MQFGITMFPTDYAIPPQELASEAEARGFESVWFPEHSQHPHERQVLAVAPAARISPKSVLRFLTTSSWR